MNNEKKLLIQKESPTDDHDPAGQKPEDLPEELYREEPVDLPYVREPQVVRHYHNLSRDSFGVDTGPYLLGSCTMK